MDDIDKMLQGEDQAQGVTAPNSSQQADPSQQAQGQQTEEEVEFNKLTGSAQDRFRELIRRAKDAEERANQTQPVYTPAQPGLLPDQKQAIETLSNFGIATDDKVKKEVTEAVSQIRQEIRNQNLRQRYNGANGEPQFDSNEVNDYVRTHPQYANYDPEDVFKFKMYPDEFSNLNTQKTSKPSRNQSLKPARTFQRQDAITPDYIEQRLKQPDGDEWYEANKDEINKVVYNHTQQFKGTNFGG